METCEFQMGSENDYFFFPALHKNSAIASNCLTMCIIITFYEAGNAGCQISSDKQLTNIDI